MVVISWPCEMTPPLQGALENGSGEVTLWTGGRH